MDFTPDDDARTGGDDKNKSRLDDAIDAATDGCDFAPDCSSCGDAVPSCDGCGDAMPGCDGLPGCDGCDVPCFDCSLGMLTLLPLLRVSAPDRLRPRRRTTAPGRAGLAAIRGYQRWISPRLPIRCRFTPSCSEYGAQAVGRYGLVAGSRLVAARISRCNHDVPYGTPDPVR